jgi:thymidylate synthase (FAD)
MSNLVTPKVYFVGRTEVNLDDVIRYLKDSGNEVFQESIKDALDGGISTAEILCSLFAKMCYKSLSIGQNKNVTKIRDIKDNLIGCFKTGHGSIFEHISFNFIATDCSRIFTHELVRHRPGMAYSQNSGRYIRVDEIDLVFDPILEPVKDEVVELMNHIELKYKELEKKLDLDNLKDFTIKKELTSALRRIAPNGQSNEIAFTANLRSLRHLIMVRTSRHAEWEIRVVFEQVYKIMKEKYPLMFMDAKEEIVKGIIEVSGMKMQPYENHIPSS